MNDARPATTPGSEFLTGFRDSFPLIAAVLPFALLFGATAAQVGYTLFESTFASATIFAGASQFVFIEVYGLHVPGWSAVLAVFAVNFRHILYSASVGRWMTRFSPVQKTVAFFFMTDLQWAASEARIHGEPRRELTPGWYFGYALPLYVLWVAGTLVGGLFGARVEEPERFGLDFLLPIYFLTILMGFRKRANFMPVVGISASASYLTFLVAGEPWHIPAGALAGVIFAALLPPRQLSTRFNVEEHGGD